MNSDYNTDVKPEETSLLPSVIPKQPVYSVERSEENLQAPLLKGIEEVRTLLKTHTYYYLHEYAVNTFNADTVISYDVNFHNRQ